VLEIQNITFAYNTKEVIKDISFSSKRGEYIAIIGESGCGKSTLLEIIYGLLHIDIGDVFWDRTKLLGPNFYLVPGEPFIKYLSQDFDLMPFTSVAENIGKFLPNRFPKEKKERTQELLEVVDMVDFSEVKVKNLSGGQKQRVALARVLAKEPELLLLDEPFSHIDNFRKNNLRRKLFKYLKEKNIGCLVATHDSTDALSFADKILVMKEGTLVAENTPQYLYNNPKTKYIASFFGDVNEIRVSDLTAGIESDNTVILYPEDLKVVSNSDFKVIVTKSFFKEGYFLIEGEFKKQSLFFKHNSAFKKGEMVCLEISEELISKRKV